MQPLAGILIIDFTTLLPGPLATLLLAEAGAEVIKIERPGGEDMRHYQPRFDGESAMFALLNRGKKSLVLDLKNEADRDKLTPLIVRADVLVEQFRPGVMARLGLGYEAVRAINPKLIYCSITGYGQTGPRAGEAGHDLNYIGLTGLLALNPGPTDRPVVPPALIADIAGGTLPAVMNILLALRQRDQSGRGLPSRHCHDGRDVHVCKSCARVRTCHRDVSRHGRRTAERRFAALSDLSDRDGKFVCCAALEQRFWEPFIAAIGLADEFIDDSRDPRRPKPPWRRSSPLKPPRNGGRSLPKPIAASPSWPPWKRRCAIRTSSPGGCSRIGSRDRPVRPCPRCRCRSIRNSVATSAWRRPCRSLGAAKLN